MTALAAQPRHPRERGFTLIEVMAVLVIIGILVGMVTLSVGRVDPDSPAAVTDRARLWLDSLQTRALTQNRDLAIMDEDGRLVVRRLDGEGWEEDGGLSPLELPPSLRWEFEPRPGDRDAPMLVMTREGAWEPDQWRLSLRADQLAASTPPRHLGPDEYGNVAIRHDSDD